MAKESGVETPTIDDWVRLDRKRKGKKLSNEDWTSPTDPDAKIARMKDGSSHLAFKPEHAVDLDTGVVVARSPIHSARRLATRRRSAPHWKRRRRTSPPWVLRRRVKIPATSWLTKDITRAMVSRRSTAGPGRPHRRTETRQGLFALAWRRRGARGGVWQPQPIEIGRRQAGHAQARRNGRAQLRPCS